MKPVAVEANVVASDAGSRDPRRQHKSRPESKRGIRSPDEETLEREFALPATPARILFLIVQAMYLTLYSLALIHMYDIASRTWQCGCRMAGGTVADWSGGQYSGSAVPDLYGGTGASGCRNQIPAHASLSDAMGLDLGGFPISRGAYDRSGMGAGAFGRAGLSAHLTSYPDAQHRPSEKSAG